jgi:hypothetical protein
MTQENATDAAQAAGVGAEVARDGSLTIAEDQQTPEAETLELDSEALQAEIKKLRREAAKYRTANKKLKEAQEAQEREKMTEAEKTAADLAKAKEQITALEAMLKQESLKAKIQAIAAEKVKPEAMDVLALLLDLDSLDEDEIGTAIDEILKAKPFLAKGQDQAGGIVPTNPAQGQTLETREQKLARLIRRESPVNVFGGNPPQP